ncbi:MAG: carbohydrate ABC transporter permease [Thermoplasmata archaeon]|uniref:Carbohydrate ABC transporter permease n=1 Tax=Candidatus Sysuiplasma superficiale TaxID=2823368 RepID=A0A8J7YIP2_9ARCH|nr:carbohydrate ABC transporter permease [Candidatus Sysuiplasma superficiale]MBX8643999.1 carbohydrate ABC transporter permease [Candidatus Sysuiplasma superficiale]
MVIVLTVLCFLSLLWLVPVYSLLINSFKSAAAVISTPVLQPSGFSLGALQIVFSEMKQSLVNSLIVTVPVAAISTFLGAMAAYYLSLKQSVFNDVVFTIIAIATFVPYQITLVPLTSLAVQLGILNTYYGLIFAFLVFYLPTGALLMSIFMAVLPKRTLEAARIDGAGDWLIFRKVVWPLVIPGAISTFMFIIVETWNNFFIPLILTSTPPMRTASVLVMSYSGSYGALYNESFAAALVSSLLPLILIVILGRYFIRGFLALGSGSKG